MSLRPAPESLQTGEPHLEPVATLPGEPPQARALTWLPLAVRYKLDRCGVRISLAQWQALDLPTRTALLEAPLHAANLQDTFARKLSRSVDAAAGSLAQGSVSFTEYVERKLARSPRVAAS